MTLKEFSELLAHFSEKLPDIQVCVEDSECNIYEVEKITLELSDKWGKLLKIEI